MFQNRCLFLYNSSAFLLSFFCITQLHRLDFVLSWNFICRTLFTFLCTDSILLYKRKMAIETRFFSFFFNHIILIRKCFLIFAYFSPFDLKRILNQKLSSLKAKFCFCDWQINVSIFSNVIRLQLPPNRERMQQKYELGTKLTYFWHKNEKKTSLKFIFVFEPLRFRHTLSFYCQNLLHK